MKKDLRGKVLKFMQNNRTEHMNSNTFIREIFYFILPVESCERMEDNFETFYSVESILRSRRKVISEYGIGIRTKADTQEEYIEEFSPVTP